ncbi:hypothetical protein [Methylobacterium sp. A54F]
MASHAYTTTPLLRPASAERRPSSPPGRLIAAGGPVSAALRTVLAADSGRQRLQELRRAIADRIEADLALLDSLDGDADLEVDAGEGPEGDDEREHDEAERGIADHDGLVEQGCRPWEVAV